MISIRSLEPADWPTVREIYAEGIATGQATLETSPPEWEVWDKSHTRELRYVAMNDDSEVIGWTALTPVSGRCVYAGVAEVSVYVGSRFRGQKIGDMLLKHLIKQSEMSGYWTLQAGIFPENLASMNLHTRNGFRLIGFRENIGKMNGVWRSVNLLERRSKVAGMD
ncbi:GNAT family N-acetyltransferase [Dyadobacter sp. CY356]|uniref:GNAT family N-acetyltransferase n=1 Tax=Dyadobacter sp. CY356 TaxID=2906442 RepID=UPI001F454BE8|nr:GNAT family N-acetyltransferase [Dyadobacter sp. CY356]MCF0054563.1 N-acetyltransferase family protein [Dyadobacter sp. CY356]